MQGGGWPSILRPSVPEGIKLSSFESGRDEGGTARIIRIEGGACKAAFMVEEPSLARQAAGQSGQCAVVAMTRWQGTMMGMGSSPLAAPTGAGRAGPAEGGGKLAIADGAAGGDGATSQISRWKEVPPVAVGISSGAVDFTVEIGVERADQRRGGGGFFEDVLPTVVLREQPGQAHS